MLLEQYFTLALAFYFYFNIDRMLHIIRILAFQILLPRPGVGQENSSVLALANFSTLIIDIPSPDVTLVLKLEPSEDIPLMLFLAYKDYPNNDNYIAKTQIPQHNSTEGKTDNNMI